MPKSTLRPLPVASRKVGKLRLMRPKGWGPRRIVWTALSTTCLACIFAGASLVGLVTHLNLPAGRKVTRDLIASSVSDLLYGTLEIDEVTAVGWDGLRAKGVRLKDEAGGRVVEITSLRAHMDVRDVLDRILLQDTPTLTVLVPHVRAERADVDLRAAPGSGVPSLVRALTPRPTPPTKSGTPGRRLRVYLPTIEIGHVYARGQFGDLPTLEATVKNVNGRLLSVPEGLAIDVRRFGAVVRGVGGADARGTGTLSVRVPGAVWGGFNGFFGDVQANVFYHVNGSRLKKATIDLPRIKPGEMRALLAEWPLHEDVTARIEASGDLPVVQTTGTFQVGNAKLSAKGKLTLAGYLGADVDVTAKNVDLRAVFPEVPQTAFNASTKLELYSKSGQPVLDVNGRTEPTELLGLQLPQIDWTGTYDERGFVGKATPHEKGLPLRTSFTVHPDGKIDLDAAVTYFDIRGAPRLRKYVDGNVAVTAKATIADSKVAGTFDADFSRFSAGPVKLGRGKLSGTARGDVDALQDLNIDAHLSGTQLRAGIFKFKRVTGRAWGRVTSPRVRAKLVGDTGPNVVASATIAPSKKTQVRNLQLEVGRKGTRLKGAVARLDVEAGAVDVRSLRLEGAGGVLTGSARIRRRMLDARIQGEGINLGTIAKVLGLPRDQLGGVFDINADVRATRGGADGYVNFDVRDGVMNGLEGISLRATTSLRDSNFKGSASGGVANLGSFGSTWDAELGGHVTEVKSWRDATGKGQIGLSQLSIGQLSALLGGAIDKVTGVVNGTFDFERESAKNFPSVYFVAGTQDLRVKGEPPKNAEATGAVPWEIAGLNFQTSGAISGESGETVATVLLLDPLKAPLLSASGTLALNLKRFVSRPKRALTQLLKTPLKATLRMPERRFSQLPEFAQQSEYTGSISGQANVEGTVGLPSMTIETTLRQLKPVGSRLAKQSDARVFAAYDATSGKFLLGADGSVFGRRVIRLKAGGTAEWDVVVGRKPATPDWWSVGGTLAFERTPLGLVAPLADNFVEGKLEGVATFERRGAAPLVSASVKLLDAKVDRVSLGTGRITVRANGQRAEASIVLKNRGGELGTTARAAFAWQDGLTPSFDDTKPVLIDVKARKYDAVVLSPLVRGVISQISGPVTADIRLALRKQRGAEDWAGTISGTGSMDGGIVQFAKLGLELRDLRLRAKATPSGDGTLLTIDDVYARARSETDNVRGSARLFLDGVRVMRGSASLSATEVPILLEGVRQGRATGQATVQINREPDRMSVIVNVPRLEAKLPRSSSRTVLPIDENPDIEIVQSIREPRNRPSERQLPWHILMRLSGDVRVTRDEMDIPVRGEPLIILDEDTRMEGYVELPAGGRFPTLGKLFVIEGGVVSFDTGDATNPHLLVTAGWRAPGGSTVYVDVTGTLNKAELTLRSDPPMAKPEIIALLLGGVSGNSSSTTGSSDSSNPAGRTALGVGGGVAAIGMKELFADTPLASFEFRTDSTSSSAPSYTAAWRAARDVWLEATYRRTTTTADLDVRAAQRDEFTGTIDWRFLPNWSLRTELGNAGSSFDLLWQYRY